MSSINNLSPIETTTPAIETATTIANLNTQPLYLKFVLVGDSTTGKTCIINRFTQNIYNDNYIPTDDPQYYSKEIIINDNFNGNDINRKYIIQLELYDTSGKHNNNNKSINKHNNDILHTNTLPVPVLSKSNSSLKSQKHPNSSNKINDNNHIGIDIDNNNDNDVDKTLKNKQQRFLNQYNNINVGALGLHNQLNHPDNSHNTDKDVDDDNDDDNDDCFDFIDEPDVGMNDYQQIKDIENEIMKQIENEIIELEMEEKKQNNDNNDINDIDGEYIDYIKHPLSLDANPNTSNEPNPTPDTNHIRSLLAIIDDDNDACPIPLTKPNSASSIGIHVHHDHSTLNNMSDDINDNDNDNDIDTTTNNDRNVNQCGYSSATSTFSGTGCNGLMFESADGLILIYDITSSSSFFNLSLWIKSFMNYSTNDSIPILILGNKSDLNTLRAIKHKQGLKFSSQLNNSLFYECSAKNDNKIIKNAFTSLARLCIYKESDILQLCSSDVASDSLHSINKLKTTYKRKKRKKKLNNGFTCGSKTSHFCGSNNGENTDPFCVVL